MSKPLPAGCIKKEEVPSWRKFDLLLETVDLDDKIGHSFVVDIHFDYKNATSRQLLYNEFFHQLLRNIKTLTVCSHHVTYVFQSESTL